MAVNVTFAPEGDVASAMTASGRLSSGGSFVTSGVTVRSAGPITLVLLVSWASTVTAMGPGIDIDVSGTATTISVSVNDDGSSVKVPAPFENTTSVGGPEVVVPWKPVPLMVTNTSVENCRNDGGEKELIPSAAARVGRIRRQRDTRSGNLILGRMSRNMRPRRRKCNRGCTREWKSRSKFTWRT